MFFAPGKDFYCQNPLKILMNEILCPWCRGKNVIHYGKRNNEQVFFCKDCKKKFTLSGLKHKTYSPKVITNAITYYNLGKTLEESVNQVNKRFKVHVSKSSLHSWIAEFSDICTYKNIRSDIVKKYKDQIIPEYSFLHSGLTYNFRYHIPKVERINGYFHNLVSYLKDMEKNCPSKIFQKGKRCSQHQLNIKISKSDCYNNACRLAALALTACTNNKKRHETVETFMLCNDSSTIACEIPVWFWEKNLGESICGHIDILQVRKGRIYLLDFKPNAYKENERKVASQLFHYASGLSFRTKISLSKFRCAWFDENIYYEFDPNLAKVKLKG